MTVYSENGWPARADTNRFVRTTAAGRSWWSATADVATVLDHYTEEYDRRVERVIRGGEEMDDWSYANRLVRGSARVVSNHGSATARDINATRHPRGVRGTFTRQQDAEIDRILHEITDDSGDPVLRHGKDYTGTVDDMHVEINAGPRSVHQAAQKIRARKKAQEDDVTPADRAAIIDGVADEVMKRLLNTRFIPNLPLDKGDPQGADWTLPAVLAAGDRKADLRGRALAEIHAAVVKPTKSVTPVAKAGG